MLIIEDPIVTVKPLPIIFTFVWGEIKELSLMFIYIHNLSY
jgi:hypothetical protein